MSGVSFVSRSKRNTGKGEHWPLSVTFALLLSARSVLFYFLFCCVREIHLTARLVSFHRISSTSCAALKAAAFILLLTISHRLCLLCSSVCLLLLGCLPRCLPVHFRETRDFSKLLMTAAGNSRSATSDRTKHRQQQFE